MLNYNIKKLVGKRVKELRLNANLTQQVVCDELQLPFSTYAYIEEGLADISLSQLIEISRFFNIEIHELVMRKDGPSIGELKEEIERFRNGTTKLQNEILSLQQKLINLYGGKGGNALIS
jgi:transcriptional regulator with XRE-family HTH domain